MCSYYKWVRLQCMPMVGVYSRQCSPLLGGDLSPSLGRLQVDGLYGPVDGEDDLSPYLEERGEEEEEEEEEDTTQGGKWMGDS